MILYMVGKLALKSPHFPMGLVKYVPGRGYFCTVPSQNGDKFATSPTPPIVEQLIWFVVYEEYLGAVDLTSHVGAIPTWRASYFLV